MQYHAPDSFDQAVSLLSDADGVTRVLAGGTDVLVQLRSGMVEPSLIVDIKRIPGVYDIAREDGGWRIGAAVPIRLGTFCYHKLMNFLLYIILFMLKVGCT